MSAAITTAPKPVVQNGTPPTRQLQVAIVGTRFFGDNHAVAMKTARAIIRKAVADPQFVALVSGGAKGIDQLAENVAVTAKKSTLIYRPDWDRYGKAAGFRRNTTIVKNADCMLAFWDGQSGGTKHSIGEMLREGKTVILYTWDDSGLKWDREIRKPASRA